MSKDPKQTKHSNPKSKTRNPKMSSFGILRFLIIGICFEFRISCFGFFFLLQVYFLPSTSFAAVATCSGSKPNFFWSSFSGADAPKVFMPIMRPDLPM
jgi:hypothetical protein